MYDYKSFYEAVNIEDAVKVLQANPEAVIISGGSDVLIKIREGRIKEAALVSIHNIKELKKIKRLEDGTIIIGAACTFSSIAENELIKQHIPMLSEAVDLVGGPQIRNMGTIGGNVCNGVTSADSASSLLTLNAKLELRGSQGTRYVPITEFYIGPGKTVRQHDEVLSAICIEKENYENFGGFYMKYGKREAMEIATLGCAINVKLSNDKKRIEDIRIAYGVAAPTPIRCRNTEELLKGLKVEDALYDDFCKEVINEVHPRTSWRASKEFRLQLVKELGVRSLKYALVRAGGEIDA